MSLMGKLKMKRNKSKIVNGKREKKYYTIIHFNSRMTGVTSMQKNERY